MRVDSSHREQHQRQQQVQEQAKISADEKTAEDPDAVDDLLSREMMRLSVHDRNALQEEIHGVRCLAVEETPELVARALAELSREIDYRTPDAEKLAYLQSLEPPRDVPEHQRILRELYHLESAQGGGDTTPYTNDDGFRLRFLRCEFFDIRKSAKRMLLFLDMALELYGDFALRRPIRLSDFSKEEIRYIRKGRFQIMPTRDRSGRRVSTIFPEQEELKMPSRVKAKICMYQSWAAGHNDIETQRKGHVLLVWIDSTVKKMGAPERIQYRFDNLKSTRVSAIHLCSPDTPYYRIRRAFAVMRTGTEDRKRLCIHLGESVELQYALQGYGIPTEDIPISWTGRIKIKNLVQWMRIRHAIESYDDHGLYAFMPPTDIVECPQPIDVLFRKGNSYTLQRGNALLRASIIDRACADDGSSNSEDNDSTKRPKELAGEIYEMRIQLKNRGSSIPASGDAIGRYLTWNSKKEWWNVMTDRETICSKIEYMVREIRKAHADGVRKSQRKRPSNRNSSSTPTAENGTEPIHHRRAAAATTTQQLSSGTHLFRSQDGSADSPFAACDPHKKRKSSGTFDCFQGTANGAVNSSDDDETGYHHRNTDDDTCGTACFVLREKMVPLV